jgi:hypothetical protein
VILCLTYRMTERTTTRPRGLPAGACEARRSRLTPVPRPEDLAEDEFLTGGEAWAQYRKGLIAPQMFGVSRTDHAWEPAEISGNAVRDLAALCK